MVNAKTTALSTSAVAGVHSTNRKTAATPNHSSVATAMLSTMPWRCASAV